MPVNCQPYYTTHKLRLISPHARIQLKRRSMLTQAFRSVVRASHAENTCTYFGWKRVSESVCATRKHTVKHVQLTHTLRRFIYTSNRYLKAMQYSTVRCAPRFALCVPLSLRLTQYTFTHTHTYTHAAATAAPYTHFSLSNEDIECKKMKSQENCGTDTLWRTAPDTRCEPLRRCKKETDLVIFK